MAPEEYTYLDNIIYDHIEIEDLNKKKNIPILLYPFFSQDFKEEKSILYIKSKKGYAIKLSNNKILYNTPFDGIWYIESNLKIFCRRCVL